MKKYKVSINDKKFIVRAQDELYAIKKVKNLIKDDAFDVLSKKYDIIYTNNLQNFLQDFNRLYNSNLKANDNDVVNEKQKVIYNIGKVLKLNI